MMDSSESRRDRIQKLLAAHKVKSVQISSFSSVDGPIETLCVGADVSDHTVFQQASLSKTVSTALCLEYFRHNGISHEASVNELLEGTSSDFRLTLGPEVDPSMTWADDIQIIDLLNHQGLGQHYVNGIPRTDEKYSIECLCRGNEKYGYPGVFVHKPPKTKFSYSGGGFLVLQLLIEALEQCSVAEVFREKLDALGMEEFQFGEEGHSASYAVGHRDDGTPVENGRLEFPAFAAGGLGPASSMCNFWQHLLRAGEAGSVFSKETADIMLAKPVDNGAMAFMGAYVGAGVFIARARYNSIAIHQAANDGFRGVYVVCVDGPDKGRGFVILSNGDNYATLINAQVTQMMLEGWHGIKSEKFGSDFDWSSLAQEEIVNLAYKTLVFDAFEPEAVPVSVFSRRYSNESEALSIKVNLSEAEEETSPSNLDEPRSGFC